MAGNTPGPSPLPTSGAEGRPRPFTQLAWPWRNGRGHIAMIVIGHAGLPRTARTTVGQLVSARTPRSSSPPGAKQGSEAAREPRPAAWLRW